MKTIIVNQPGDVQVIERDMPVRKPGEALLKVLYGGICGSDLGTYRGTFNLDIHTKSLLLFSYVHTYILALILEIASHRPCKYIMPNARS
jgi:threonine dehydrogenase-like Zn-dependent dehydrogenase